MVRPHLCAEADDPDRTGGCVFAHPVNRTSMNGVTGSPSQASADKGRQWFDWMVEDLSALILQGMTETPPLDHSYFEIAAELRPTTTTPDERFTMYTARRVKNAPAQALHHAWLGTAIDKDQADREEWSCSVTERGVKYCIGAYVDIHGVPKAKVVPHRTICAHMANGSERYTGYALDGLGQAPNDDEIASVPDLSHIIQLPWEPKIAWMPADNHFKGKPYPLNTRVALKNQLAAGGRTWLRLQSGHRVRSVRAQAERRRQPQRARMPRTS